MQFLPSHAGCTESPTKPCLFSDFSINTGSLSRPHFSKTTHRTKTPTDICAYTRKHIHTCENTEAKLIVFQNEIETSRFPLPSCPKYSKIERPNPLWDYSDQTTHFSNVTKIAEGFVFILQFTYSTLEVWLWLVLALHFPIHLKEHWKFDWVWLGLNKREIEFHVIFYYNLQSAFLL